MNCECDSSKQFKCDNGKCIQNEWKCDTMTDCDDGSDEPENCAVQNCTGSHQFACANGNCFSSTFKCDGDVDCQPNGEDEVGCEFVTDNTSLTNIITNSTTTDCLLGEFQCKSGHCISGHLRCNLIPNCSDQSDEENCSLQTCNDNEFQCPNSSLCILNDWRCDRDFDCPFGTDETNCTTGCLARDFTCTNKQCIYAPWRCDGDVDCEDQSDEDTKMCSKLACPPNRFRCQSGICLSRAKVCNKIADCDDASDEEPTLCENIQRQCLGGWTLNNNGAGQNLHLERFVCSNKHCIDG